MGKKAIFMKGTRRLHPAGPVFLGVFLASVVAGVPQGTGADDPWMAELAAFIELVREHSVNYGAAPVLEAVREAVVVAVDPGGSLLTREDFEEAERIRNGKGFHPGLDLRFSEGQPVVAAVEADSPAAAAGLQAGDLIVRIAEQPVEGLIPPEATSLLRGGKPQTVELEYVREGTPVVANLDFDARFLPAIEVVELFHNGIVYVLLNGLFEGSGGDLARRIKAWQEDGRFGVVLDLRKAGGTHLESVHHVLQALASGDEELYAFVDRNGRAVATFAANGQGRARMPVMMLVGPRTSGAAELLAAACKGRVRGVLLLGQPTAGDPLLREYVPVDESRGLHMATRTLRAGTRVYDGTRGVEPDMPVPDRWHDDAYAQPDTGRSTEEEKAEMALRERVRGDGPLSRAIDLLRGLRALNIRPSLQPSGD